LESENILIKPALLVFQGDVEASLHNRQRSHSARLSNIGSWKQGQKQKTPGEAEQAAEIRITTFTAVEASNIRDTIPGTEKEAEAFQAKADQRDDAIVTHILWKLYHFQRVGKSTASYPEHQENLRSTDEVWKVRKDSRRGPSSSVQSA